MSRAASSRPEPPDEDRSATSRQPTLSAEEVRLLETCSEMIGRLLQRRDVVKQGRESDSTRDVVDPTTATNVLVELQRLRQNVERDQRFAPATLLLTLLSACAGAAVGWWSGQGLSGLFALLSPNRAYAGGMLAGLMGAVLAVAIVLAVRATTEIRARRRARSLIQWEQEHEPELVKAVSDGISDLLAASRRVESTKARRGTGLTAPA